MVARGCTAVWNLPAKKLDLRWEWSPGKVACLGSTNGSFYSLADLSLATQVPPCQARLYNLVGWQTPGGLQDKSDSQEHTAGGGQSQVSNCLPEGWQASFTHAPDQALASPMLGSLPRQMSGCSHFRPSRDSPG